MKTISLILAMISLTLNIFYLSYVYNLKLMTANVLKIGEEIL